MKEMRKIGYKKGFTLVELSLSIAFISILSITIALIINDAISTYRRGLTLNQINTVGMDLVDDIRAAVQNSPSKAVEEDFVFKKKAEVSVDNDDNWINVPIYGTFCTGSYSYIWNSGYLYSNEYGKEIEMNPVKLKYNNETEIKEGFRLLKVKDRSRAVCKEVRGDSDIIDISGYDVLVEEPVILLANDTSNSLALYDLSVAAPASNTLGNSLFYSISFILGTVQGGINVMSSGNFCKAPAEYNSNFDYCAINKFNFAAQATGG